MRERLFFKLSLYAALRITPAYAGKTCFVYTHKSVQRDHPRVCGKDKETPFSLSSFQGSPPRMRERLYAERLARALKGITPAYAGKTCVGYDYCERDGDHPRVCGKD